MNYCIVIIRQQYVWTVRHLPTPTKNLFQPSTTFRFYDLTRSYHMYGLSPYNHQKQRINTWTETADERLYISVSFSWPCELVCDIANGQIVLVCFDMSR